MNIIDQLNAETIEQSGKSPAEFAVGDTLRVHVKVREGNRERIQVFEGVCIARKNAGVNSNFTVRKISYGEGVERVFPLFSPFVDKIERMRRGDVRRAKLYYLRGRAGKSARISEKMVFQSDAAAKAVASAAQPATKSAKETPAQAPEAAAGESAAQA